MGAAYSIPGVYRHQRTRAEGFPRVRTDICGMVGAAGPRHLGEATAVNDWKSYVSTFRQDPAGKALPPPQGGALDAAVRDYFTNGGRRLWIVNVAEDVTADPQTLLDDTLGLGQSLKPHGLELLLRQAEVSMVVLPDLDARRVVLQDRADPLPGGASPCFHRCGPGGVRRAPAGATHSASVIAEERLLTDDQMLWAQQYLLDRLAREKWRWFAIIAPPPGRTAQGAVDWRDRLTGGSAGAEHAALYWPWLMAQDSPGAPVRLHSPVGTVAGIFARTDIEIGPHAAPARRQILGAIGPEMPVSDTDNALAYDAGVNVLRDFPGRGPIVWGARTLRWRSREDRGEVMAYVAPRRCLNAIARTAQVISAPIVFEPSDVYTRIKLHQLMTDYLLRVFAQGVLKGDEAQDAFFVRVEALEASPEGHVITRIGVALAAPAEFIEFRVGRETGVVETGEAA